MSALASDQVLRAGGPRWKRALFRTAMAAVPLAFRLLRRFSPVMRLGNLTIVTRYDDVHQVFADDASFAVPYKPKLDVIMGGQPFFLGMGNTVQYQADVAALRSVVRPADLPTLGIRAQAMAERIVAGSGGRIDVVDTLVRTVTFDLLSEYLGVPEPSSGNLRVWGTRLFEFQFVDGGNDPSLRRDVDEIAPALRAHIQAQIDGRRVTPADRDDLLGRCLDRQAHGDPMFTDDWIRTALMGLIVGGPPQPPMVVPQGLNQLLSRRDALAGAQDAANADDDDLLAGYLLEAMRFDPLAPGMPRLVTRATVIANGTKRARSVPAGSSVLAASASAMMDPRRVVDPWRFDPRRLAHEYLHYGFGLHECFGRQINRATLHRMIKPLLRRSRLRRAPGALGRLTKQGVFAERLVVLFDP